MIRIGIYAALEKKARAGENITAEIVALIDRARAAKAEPKTTGVGYGELVAMFREVLGDKLAVPPSPDHGWKARQVNRARDIFGPNTDGLRVGVGDLAAAACRTYPRGPYALDFLLNNAVRLLHTSVQPASTAGAVSGSPVRTGREWMDE